MADEDYNRGHVLSPLAHFNRHMVTDHSGHYAYSVKCSCGWHSTIWTSPEGAYRDALKHVDDARA